MAMKPISVSQLNNYVKRNLQTDPILANITVEGEVSNLKYHDSGHVYFSLKDENSKVNCFLAAGNAGKISFALEEGMKVVAAGYVSVYERGGYYSLNIKELDEFGKGDLAEAFEKLKCKLKKEGLFDESHKKSISTFPKNIILITAATGAAVRDMIRIIEDKNSVVNVLVYPVLVQGPAAAGDIAAAIDDVNEKFPETDIIITGRGGGSIEELWAFNEEQVARSVFASKIPVISAVGHEVDFTIADFVADMRAPTPTAAADMAVPNTEELKEDVENLGNAIEAGLHNMILRKKDKLESLNMNYYGTALMNLIENRRLKCEATKENAGRRIEIIISNYQKALAVFETTLKVSSPKNILKKGYSIVTDKEGNIISSVKKTKAGDELRMTLSDGRVDVSVIDKEEYDGN